MKIKKILTFCMAVLLSMQCFSVCSSAESVPAQTKTVSGTEEFLSALAGAEDGDRILLHGGMYRLSDVLHIENKKNLTITACDGEEAVLTNAMPVTGWSECTVNGKQALCADAQGRTVSALFNEETGECPVARLPESGYYHLNTADHSDTKGSGQDLASIAFYASDLAAAPANLQDVRVGILHQWVTDLAAMVSYDAATGRIQMSKYSGRPIEDGDRYYLSNIMEGMQSPGSWCFDSAADKIYYLPKEGETAENLCLYASSSASLLTVENCENLAFENIRFADTGWEYGDESNLTTDIHTQDSPWAKGSYQGGNDISGAVTVGHSENVSFAGCEFVNIGVTALRFENGAAHCRAENCLFDTVGGSAVFIGGAYFFAADRENREEDGVHDITVQNCEIRHYGTAFAGACGILLTYCDTALLANNEIHDGYYTGISAGYTWLFFDNPTQNIEIRDNLIYDIGLYTLSDLGGIYMLGVQDGTVIAGNVIHDVTCYDGADGYAGNGIYLDSGCTGMTVENNLVYNCSTSGFNTTLSRSNVIANNIFALCGQSAVCLGMAQYEDYFTELHSVYKNNIFLTDNRALVAEYLANEEHFRGKGNIIWDMTNGDELYFSRSIYSNSGNTVCRQTAERKGLLSGCLCGDPGFADAASFDFTLSADSFAVRSGFVPFDYTTAGTKTGTVIGLSEKGGQTAYNDHVKPISVFTQADVPVTEKIAAVYYYIYDRISDVLRSVLGLRTAEGTVDAGNISFENRTGNETTERIAALLDTVKTHIPTYRVDESRKPFADDDRIQAIYFTGEICEGKETEVFAYIGIPEGASASNPVPAMVLVHGGGVHAQADWVQYWVDHGYAAISFDGFGQQPKTGAYSADGNNNPDWTYNPDSHLPFSDFSDIDNEITEQWFYYYITDIILSNNILRNDDRILHNCIGLSGISWGGYAASVAMGYDSRFAFAIPIYGCPYSDSSAAMSSYVFNDEKVKSTWEPSLRLDTVTMPVLFVNGNDDPFFAADCTSAAAEKLQNGQILLLDDIGHGAFAIPETIRFANEQTGKGAGNSTITGLHKDGNCLRISFKTSSDAIYEKVTLYYRETPLTYENMQLQGEWKTKRALVVNGTASVTVPDSAVLYYVAVDTLAGSVFDSEQLTTTGLLYRP